MAQSLLAKEVHWIEKAESPLDRKSRSRFYPVFKRGAHPDLSMRANFALLRHAERLQWKGDLVQVAERVKETAGTTLVGVRGAGMAVALEVAGMSAGATPLFWS